LLSVVGVVALTAGVLGVVAASADPTKPASGSADLSAAVAIPVTPGGGGVTQKQIPDLLVIPPGSDMTQGKTAQRISAKAQRVVTLRDRAEAKALAEAKPTVFKVGSLNVLGASHSDGGNKGRYADGAARVRSAAAKIRGLGISVMGLQEYEPKQHFAFVNATGWGVFPGMSMGTRGVRNSIAWNPAVWTLVESHTGTTPYFRGNQVPLPYVLLENKATGGKAWFISIHNPISSGKRGQNQKWRSIATAKQAALMASLRAQSGYPVFLTGDFNERGEAFCRVTAGGRAIAANGGTSSPCRLPGTNGIDWIFASPSGVSFTGYVRDNSTIGRISDHPLIYATATLAPQPKTD